MYVGMYVCMYIKLYDLVRVRAFVALVICLLDSNCRHL